MAAGIIMVDRLEKADRSTRLHMYSSKVYAVYIHGVHSVDNPLYITW